ncbi:MAG: translocation/assembly module TamB domain-containing protein [Alphaproteobacteria bacterium]|nr:translocation/assembly module TamB domain-containing protein [Alphaproteobacteria bacterium]
MLLALPFVLVFAAYTWLITPAGNRMIKGQIVSLVSALMDEGRLEIDSLDTNLLRHTRVEGLRLLDGEGRVVIGLESADLSYRLGPLLTERAVVVSGAVLDKAAVDLQVDADGQLDLSRMFPSSDEPSEPGSGLPITVRLEDVQLKDSAVRYALPDQAWGADGLELKARARLQGNTYAVEQLSLSGQMREPEAGELGALGALTWDDGDLSLSDLALRLGDIARLQVTGSATALTGEDPEVKAHANVDRLDLDALEVFTGDIGINGLIEGTVDAEGPLSALLLRPSLKVNEGSLSGEATLDLAAERLSWEATLDASGVDVQALVDAVTEPTTLNASVALSGGGISWPDDLEVQGDLRLADSVTWGYRVPDATARVELVQGVAQLTGVRYVTDYATVTGDGALTDTHIDLYLVANIRDLGGLEEFGASNLEGDGVARGRLWVDWSGEVAEVTFEGSAKGGALGYVDVFTAGEWETPVNMRWDGDTWVQGEASLSSVDAYGVNTQLLRGPWTVEVLEDGSVSWDVPELGMEDVSAYGAHLAAIVGTVQGGMGADEVVRTDVGLYLSQLGYRDLGAPSGTAEVKLDGDALVLDIDLYDGEDTVLMLEGGADLATARYEFETLALGREGPERLSNPRPVAFTLGEAGLVDADIALRSEVGSAEVLGTLGAEGPLDGELEVTDLDLGWLGGVLSELAGYDGAVSADLRLGGTAEAVELKGRVRGAGLVVPDSTSGALLVDRLDASVDLDLREGRLGFDGDLNGRGRPLMGLRGALPVKADLEDFALDARADADLQLLLYPGEFKRLAEVLPSLGELPEGRVSAELRSTGPLIDPDLTIQASVHAPVSAGGAWLRSNLEVTAADGQLSVTADAWERGQRRLELTGGARTALQDILVWTFEGGPEPALDDPSTYLSALELRAVPLAVPVETLSLFTELPDGLTGELSGAVLITGEPRAPQLSGGLQLTNAKVGEVILAPAVLGVQPDPERRGYTLFATMGFSEDEDTLGEHTLDINGFLPFSYSLDSDFDMDAELARTGLNLAISGTGVPFAVLSVIDPAIQDGRGVVLVQGDITGSIRTPEADVGIDMVEGYFRYKDIGVAFDEVTLHGRLQGDEVRLDTLSFRTIPDRTIAQQTVKVITAKDIGTARKGCGASFTPPLRSGDVRISGSSTLADFALAEVDFDICAFESYFSAVPELKLQLTAEMDMVGPWPNVLVEGDVVADDVFYSMDEGDFFGGGGLELDPTLTIVRGEDNYKRASDADAPPFWWDFDIQLSIDLARKATLDVTVPLLETYDALNLSTMQLKDTVLDGVIDFRMYRDLLTIVGAVNTRRGTVTVMNEDFELSEESTLTFSGQEYTNPALDITATHDAGGYGLIDVRITQSVELPSIEFVSDQGYSITDVLSILLIGRPTTDLGQAGAGVLGDITSFLASQASGALSDQFEVFGGGSIVDSFQVGSDANAVFSSVKLGSTIGDRAYLELQLNRDPDEDEAPTELTLEYVLTRRLEGVLHVGGENSADVYANWRF